MDALDGLKGFQFALAHLAPYLLVMNCPLSSVHFIYEYHNSLIRSTVFGFRILMIAESIPALGSGWPGAGTQLASCRALEEAEMFRMALRCFPCQQPLVA